MHRHTPAYALAALAVGLTLYILGYATATVPVRTAGLVTAIAALPAVVITQQRRDRQYTDDERAATDRAAYWRGVDHTIRGLLDPPPAPTGGTHHDTPTATVHYLYAPPPDRKAQ